mgnify:CR=1 FL=1
MEIILAIIKNFTTWRLAIISHAKAVPCRPILHKTQCVLSDDLTSYYKVTAGQKSYQIILDLSSIASDSNEDDDVCSNKVAG